MLKLKSSYRKLLISGIYLIAIAIILTIGFLHFTGYFWALSQDAKTQQPTNLKFDFHKLPPSDRPAEYPDIGEVEWIDTHTLRVEVVIPTNCGAIWWCGNYKVFENSLNLKYKSLLNEFLACGWEPVHLTYIIQDMPKKNYDVTIEETERLIRN